MKVIFPFIILLVLSCNSHNTDSQIILDGFEINNKQADSLNNLGIELSQSKKLKKGLEAFLKANKLEPYNPTILNNIGLNYRLNGETDLAV